MQTQEDVPVFDVPPVAGAVRKVRLLFSDDGDPPFPGDWESAFEWLEENEELTSQLEVGPGEGSPGEKPRTLPAKVPGKEYFRLYKVREGSDLAALARLTHNAARKLPVQQQLMVRHVLTGKPPLKISKWSDVMHRPKESPWDFSSMKVEVYDPHLSQTEGKKLSKFIKTRAGQIVEKQNRKAFLKSADRALFEYLLQEKDVPDPKQGRMKFWEKLGETIKEELGIEIKTDSLIHRINRILLDLDTSLEEVKGAGNSEEVDEN